MTRRSPRLLGRFLILAVGVTTLLVGSLPAGAAQATVGLGTAASFAVLGGSEVTNTGPSVIKGDVGVSPGTAITGFTPEMVDGTFHSADTTADNAQLDTTTAYNDAAGRTPFTAVATELGGSTLEPGVYRNTTLGITDTLTLDAKGDPNAVFIFQAGSTLITASGSKVSVVNGAQACNVFWQVGSSATLGTGTQFVGTILAMTSITAETGATVHGRLLARDGAVTLDTNTITASTCAAAPTTTTTTAAATTTTTAVSTTETTLPDTGSGTTDFTGTSSGGTPTDGQLGGNGPDGGSASSTGGTAGGDGSATATTLPRTGSALMVLTATGTLAVLVGAAMLRRSH